MRVNHLQGASVKSTARMVVFTLLAVGGMGAVGWAQGADQGDQGPRASKYYISLGTQDELLIKVNVWGQVAQPGQYMIPDKTDLISLISFAGGPTEDARISNVRLIRKWEGQQKVLSVDVQHYLDTGDTSHIPVLMPEDTVVVPANSYRLFSRLVGVVSQVAIIANVYYLLFQR